MDPLFYTFGAMINNIGGVIICFVAIIFRLIGFARHLPFLGFALKNNTARNSIIFCLTISIFPHIYSPEYQSYSLEDIIALKFLFLSIQEFLIGYIIGFIVSFPFYVFQTAGAIIDAAKGSSSIVTGSNLVQGQSSITSTVFLNILTVHVLIFPDFTLEIFKVIVQSFIGVPYFSNVFASIFSSDPIMFFTQINKIFSDGMILASRLSAPILTLSLCSDLSLSLVNRLMPQAQITFLSVPIKSTVSLLFIGISWLSFFDEIHATFYSSSRVAQNLFGNFLY